jgi:hypothetical protein
MIVSLPGVTTVEAEKFSLPGEENGNPHTGVPHGQDRIERRHHQRPRVSVANPTPFRTRNCLLWLPPRGFEVGVIYERFWPFALMNGHNLRMINLKFSPLTKTKAVL